MAAATSRDDGRRGVARRRTTLLVPLVVAAWLAAVAVPPIALVGWRDKRLAELAGPEPQRQWDAFRDDMRLQTGRTGPVQRKVPKSAEPPELVWLRDHLQLAVVAWVTLVGVLGGFLAAVVVGIARTSAAEDRPPGDGHDKKQDERDEQHADERRHD